MKNIFIVLVLIGVSTATIQAQKKPPRSETGELIIGLQKQLLKQYKFQNVNVYILAGKLKIDIADSHVKALPKDIRESRSKEIADYAKTFLDKTPEGKKMLKGIHAIGVTHFSKANGNAFSFTTAPYDSYNFDY